jgi:hypothetical protein
MIQMIQWSCLHRGKSLACKRRLMGREALWSGKSDSWGGIVVMDADAAKALIGTKWVHSHEEDHGDEVVFRAADYAFPPSRGRGSFELHSNGDMTASGPGPTDRRKSQVGRWSLAGDSLTLLPGTDKPQVLRIKAIGEGRLVVDRKV